MLNRNVLLLLLVYDKYEKNKPDSVTIAIGPSFTQGLLLPEAVGELPNEANPHL